MDTHITSALSIHKAAAQGDLNRVKWLLETGAATVNEKDGTFRASTILHYAAQGGQKKVIEFLLSKGAIVDVRDNNSSTPLTLAIYEGHIDATQLLLKKEQPQIMNLDTQQKALTYI